MYTGIGVKTLDSSTQRTAFDYLGIWTILLLGYKQMQT